MVWIGRVGESGMAYYWDHVIKFKDSTNRPYRKNMETTVLMTDHANTGVTQTDAN